MPADTAQAVHRFGRTRVPAGPGDAIANGINALNADLDTAAQTLDGNANLADPKTYAKQRAEQTAAERKKLDAAKKNSSKGKGDRTWSEVASEMNVILDKAYKAAISGKGAEGSSLVNNAYYQYYEKLGFEKNVMNAISGDRVSQVEYQFKMTRKTMRDGGSDKEIKKLVDDLKSWLVETRPPSTVARPATSTPSPKPSPAPPDRRSSS